MSTYTEEEAKTKWCPFKRASVSHEPATGNHACNVFPDGSRGHQNTLCIASACMAWRAVTINELSEVVFAGTREGKRGTGYCGLAGRPE